jgi:hypothetical protein
MRVSGAAMTVLLYFVSIFSLLALLASAVAGTIWVLARSLRALTTRRAKKRRADAAADFHPHHLKRAGQ